MNRINKTTHNTTRIICGVYKTAHISTELILTIGLFIIN